MGSGLDILEQRDDLGSLSEVVLGGWRTEMRLPSLKAMRCVGVS